MNATIMLMCLVIILILVVFTNNTSKKKKNKEIKLNHFPWYPTYPLIGNLNLISFSLNGFTEKMGKLLSSHRQLIFWVGPEPLLLLWKYEDIMAVSVQNQFRDMRICGDEWIGIGIINAKYDEWKKSRKMLTPAFGSEMLSKYVNVFKRTSSALVDSLKEAADSSEVVDVSEYMMKSNIDAIVENTIGVPIQGMGEKGRQYGDATKEAIKSMTKRTLTPWLHSTFMYNAYLKLTRKMSLVNILRDLPTKILKSKLIDCRNQNDLSKDSKLGDTSKVIIDFILEGSKRESTFTKTRMRDELLHIIFAATETSSLSASFLLLMLAIHQDIQQKVYEEIVQLFENNDIDTLTSDHLFNGLSYLEQCIRETNRRYSPVAFTIRYTHKDCVLKDNKIIPAKTKVLQLIHLSNNDAELYENPRKWDPEHFSEEAVRNRPKGSFLAFGYGPRSCIGKGLKYSMLLIKTQIVYILRNYHLSTNIEELTENHLHMDMSIRSKIGYPIRFRKR